ncbi:MAG: ComF family protein [Candidatus Nealsonbacteria bacterium]|nr:ComF family protein [Candidatus Nealsonbacteria bacterium]
MNTCQVLNKIKENILDILLPRFCVGCGREGLYICKNCEVFLSEVENTIPGLTSVWEYEGLMEKLIYKIKFDGCYDIIDELVEKALGKIDLRLPEDTYITYVPMFKRREKQRGFNQSELIARRIADVFGLVEHKLLEKVEDKRSQVGLGPKERTENVKDVFRVSLTPGVSPSTPGVYPKNVLLVDDVYTTGATMNECAKVLKRAGVKNVWGFTLARKLRI